MAVSEVLVFGHELAYGLVCSRIIPRRLRSRLLSLLGLDVGGALIESGVRLLGRRIEVGAQTYIARGVYIDASFAEVVVGRSCAIGPHVRIVSSDHEQGGHDQRAGAPVGAPVRIGDGVWVGAGAVVLPGANVADGCIVAAGAVVTGATEPDGLYAGVPARRIRDLPT